MLYADLKVYVKSLNPAEVAANTTVEQDFTVSGVTVQDIILAFSKPTASAGLGIVNVRVKATDTISVTFVNATAAPINAGAENYTIVTARSKSTTPTDGDTL